jgi:uncharacterized protein YcnI
MTNRREQSLMSSRNLRRIAALLIAVPTLTLSAALPASAHVSVHADNATAGATDSVLTFRVPNEMDHAHTVGLRVFLSIAMLLLGVLVELTPGWSFRVRSSKLAKPVETDDGPIAAAVSEVTWSGGQIPVGGFQDFHLTVGELPDETGTLTFKAIQTYSNGRVVRWIETAPPGSPEPERPAPTLQLTEPVSAQLAASNDDTSNGTDRGLAIAALAVAVIALWVAVFRGVRPRQR